MGGGREDAGGGDLGAGAFEAVDQVEVGAAFGAAAAGDFDHGGDAGKAAEHDDFPLVERGKVFQQRLRDDLGGALDGFLVVGIS